MGGPTIWRTALTRSLTVTAVAMLALSSCTQIQSPARDEVLLRKYAQRATSGPSVRMGAGRAHVDIPLSSVIPYLIVDVEINGTTQPFIVDTGASITILDTRQLTDFGLQKVGGQVEVVFSVGKGRADLVSVNTLRMGELVIGPMVCGSMDLERLRDFTGVSVAGVIGCDVLAANPFTLDPVRGLIRFHRRDSFRPDAGAREHPLWISPDGRPVVLAALQGDLAARLFLDTGSNGGVTVVDRLQARRPDWRWRPGAFPGLTLGLGGWRGSRSLADERITLFGDAITAPINMVWLSEGEEGWPGADGSVGLALLTHWRLTFDFASARLWATKYPSEVRSRAVAPRVGIDGWTTLMQAAYTGDLASCSKEIRRGADVNATNAAGASALLVAIGRGHADIVRALIAAGATQDALLNAGGEGAVHLAVRKRNGDILRLLCEHGANVNHVNAFGYSPLYLAACAGDVEAIRTLLSCGADISGGSEESLATPLLIATQCAQREAVQALIDGGARIEQASRTPDRRTPLMVASFNGDTDIVEVLLRAGADVTSVDAKGQTAVELAAQRNRCACVDLLLKHGGNRNRAQKAALDHGATAVLTHLMVLP